MYCLLINKNEEIDFLFFEVVEYFFYSMVKFLLIVLLVFDIVNVLLFMIGVVGMVGYDIGCYYEVLFLYVESYY